MRQAIYQCPSIDPFYPSIPFRRQHHLRVEGDKIVAKQQRQSADFPNPFLSFPTISVIIILIDDTQLIRFHGTAKCIQYYTHSTSNNMYH
mmetsp:Transcript_8721/g.25081  ORF Transcript_8721/g.25081 Transcript_8721/m.25081 type:complete len:90 (-) Transcript_8721:13-282(-)